MRGDFIAITMELLPFFGWGGVWWCWWNFNNGKYIQIISIYWVKSSIFAQEIKCKKGNYFLTIFLECFYLQIFLLIWIKYEDIFSVDANGRLCCFSLFLAVSFDHVLMIYLSSLKKPIKVSMNKTLTISKLFNSCNRRIAIQRLH